MREPESLLRATFELEEGEDHASLVSVVRVDGLTELPPYCVLADLEWFRTDWENLGPDFLEGEVEGFETLSRLVVEGRMWSERYSTCDGTFDDAGFTVERVIERVQRPGGSS